MKTSVTLHIGWAAVGVALSVMALSILVQGLGARVAYAEEQVPAPSCVLDGDYGTVGAQEDPSNSTSDDSRGTRSSVYVNGGATDCQKISSIYVASPSFNGSFEFGWVTGFSSCSSRIYAHPHLFWWAVQASTGSVTCGVWATSPLPTEDAYSTFRVSDIDANTYWGSYFNGSQLQPNGINMDFARGHSIVGMERGSVDDSCYARWNSLEEFHDANGWSAWDNAQQFVDSDPKCDFNRLNAYTASSFRAT